MNKTHVVQEAIVGKLQAYLIPKNGKEVPAFIDTLALWNFGGPPHPCHPGTVPLSFITPGKKKKKVPHVELGIRATSHL